MRRYAILIPVYLLAASTAAFVACSSSSTPATSNDGGTNPPGQDSGPTPTDSGGGDSTVGPQDSGTPGDSGKPTDSGASDSGDASPGYLTLPFPDGGSPDAIYWDNTNQVLYVVNDLNNRVWKYTDTAGFSVYGTVPDSPALDDAGETKLNGLTELSDGTLLVTRFGYGTGGALYTLSPDGGSSTVPNVPGAERRITVTTDPATGIIYSDAFTKSGSTVTGVVETVSLDSGTTPYATGTLGKTVGLLVQGSNILVADQGNNVIVAIPTDPTQIADGGATLSDGGLFPQYALLSGPDQLTNGPSGSIFTDQFFSGSDGGQEEVRQVWPDGSVNVPWPTVPFASLSCVAYDATNNRLFVVENNGTVLRQILVLPVAH